MLSVSTATLSFIRLRLLIAAFSIILNIPLNTVSYVFILPSYVILDACETLLTVRLSIEYPFPSSSPLNSTGVQS